MLNPEEAQELKKETRGMVETSSKMQSRYQDFCKKVVREFKGENVVMIIDDEDTWITVLKRRFDQFGIQVVDVNDHSKAYKSISMFQPKYVVLDRTGVKDFHHIINEFGDKVIVFTAYPEAIDAMTRGSVLAVYGKDRAMEMTNFIRKKIEGENGSCD